MGLHQVFALLKDRFSLGLPGWFVEKVLQKTSRTDSPEELRQIALPAQSVSIMPTTACKAQPACSSRLKLKFWAAMITGVFTKHADEAAVHHACHRCFSAGKLAIWTSENVLGFLTKFQSSRTKEFPLAHLSWNTQPTHSSAQVPHHNQVPTIRPHNQMAVCGWWVLKLAHPHREIALRRRRVKFSNAKFLPNQLRQTTEKNSHYQICISTVFLNFCNRIYVTLCDSHNSWLTNLLLDFFIVFTQKPVSILQTRPATPLTG